MKKKKEKEKKNRIERIEPACCQSVCIFGSFLLLKNVQQYQNSELEVSEEINGMQKLKENDGYKRKVIEIRSRQENQVARERNYGENAFKLG